MHVRRIDLERARREAKALLRAAQGGDATALARMRAVGGELQLATAQFAIARQQGERSWPALVERGERESASRHERAEAFVRAATSDRLDHADALLGDDRSIVRALPAAALVWGEPVTVDPLVPLAPLGWLPLVYVAHSRYLGGPRTDALVASAERLLDAGADPNGAYEHEEFGAQSVLYGAAGIAHDPRLTAILLERGADPDDDESLYHATEARDLTCVRLLLGAGATVSGTNALAHAIDREDPELVALLLAHGPAVGERWAELDKAPGWAVFRNRSTAIMRLLAEHGANLELPETRTGRAPYALAIARGRPDLAEVLVEHGASPTASDSDRLIGDCLRGDRASAIARVAADPTLAAAARVELGQALVVAAGEGRVEATGLLLDVGAPTDARGDLGGSALHHAAWQGRGGTVDLLLRRGADPLALASEPTGGTPLAWAAHGSRHAQSHGDAYLGIGRRLVYEGDVRDPGLAERAAGDLAAWLGGADVDEPGPAPEAGVVDYGELAWRLQVESLRVLATLPQSASRPVGEGFAVRSGPMDNTMNGVVCDDCTQAEVSEAQAWLAGAPSQWFVGPRSGLRDVLVAAGLRPEQIGVVMGGSRGALELAGAVHEIRPVADDADLAAWLGVGEDWGFLDGPEARASFGGVFAELLAVPGFFRIHVAWSGGLAVGAIATQRHGEVVAIDHLGVREGSLRRGIGRALIAAALEAEPGWEHTVLHPTPSSIPFYERLGFAMQRFPRDRRFYLPMGPDPSA
jgi:ankyrin repeat protein/GNAT superfamily N-acetyltransferase